MIERVEGRHVSELLHQFMNSCLFIHDDCEAVYPVSASPVSQAITWNGKVGHPFTLRQIISNFRYYGNDAPHGLDESIAAKIRDHTVAIAGQAFSGSCSSYAAFACTWLQNSARRSARRNVAGLALGDAISATSVLSIGANPSFAVSTR
jgi:hypothetical protein